MILNFGIWGSKSKLLILLISEMCWINCLVGEYLHITLYCHYQKHLLPVFFIQLSQISLFSSCSENSGFPTHSHLSIFCASSTCPRQPRKASTSRIALANNPISAELCGWTEKVLFHTNSDAPPRTRANETSNLTLNFNLGAAKDA